MLPDTLQRAETVFRGVRFEVRRLELPGRDGKTHRKEVVVHPGAVVVMAMPDPRNVVLIHNERFAVGQTLWELPAGTLEHGEAPDVCADRELIEETGYRARRITAMADFYTSPGICTERMYAFLARDLEKAQQDLDETERITVEVVPLERAIDMVKRHEIRDGKTIATLLYYHVCGRELNR